MRFKNGSVRFFKFFVLTVVTKEEGTGNIRTVSPDFATKINENLVSETKFGIPRFIVGNGRVCAESYDRGPR